ncbi:unnamed protein product [Ceutorhynchus assimilis]|uniref:Protein sleepless n=1 Tax=Ceutorhynchus assimilis TaxID=467358 RepID=A0A9N9MQT4_9CUCU|nr:unnamed protein product [Ceutorhynchus assimilis]
MFRFFNSVAFVAVVGVVSTVSANVSQCYHCDSIYCAGSYDVQLGEVVSCSDIYKNAKSYSGKIVVATKNASSDQASQFGLDNSGDIETINSEDTNEVIRRRTHAEFFDIQRKLWEFFHKGEIDANTEFACVKANYYNNEYGQVKTYRGCLPKYTKTVSTACDFLTKNVLKTSTSTLYECHTCDSNLCNSGISFNISFILILLGLIFKIFIF